MRNKRKIIRAVTVSMSIEFFEGLIPKLEGEGYEVVALSSPGAELTELADRGVKTIALPMERHISLWRDGVALVRLIGVFWRERPQMVHSMTPKAGLLCMVAAWLTRVPVRVHTFTGLIWPTAVGTKRRILMLTDRILCACATHIIPEGQGVMNDLRQVTRKPMKVLGYGNCRGIDLERFDAQRFILDKNSQNPSIESDSASTLAASACQTESKLSSANQNHPATICDGSDSTEAKNSQKPFTFLFVGRIVGDKGINELVKAFCRLKITQEGLTPMCKFRLRLVGNYEKELDPISEETQKMIELTPEIETPGAKSGDDLIREYAEADCFVMPSYREGFPNTVLEAGAMGLPQIVTDINGSREIIVPAGKFTQEGLTPMCNFSQEGLSLMCENGIRICANGLIVPPRSEEALYEAMKRMVDDREMREAMAREARPMIASRFEKGFVQQCLLDYYKEIMK